MIDVIYVLFLSFCQPKPELAPGSTPRSGTEELAHVYLESE